MLLTTAIISVLAGISLTLLVQLLFLRYQFRLIPKRHISRKPQFERFRLPKELHNLVRDNEQGGKKETCLFINMIFQFLFRELKDTKQIRQWAVKKMNVEFTEMLQTTSGKLVEQITVREFSLGDTFPVIHSVEIKNISIEEESIEELDVAVDLEYNGGFQLAVDVDLIFGKLAYLSIMVTKLKGLARLQLTRNPYTHWSFAFYEEPHIEFSVDSSFEGRQIRQITSLIVNQIKRTIRKKHTLPNYKMRFRPFFFKPETFRAVKDLYLHGNKVGLGQLEVTVMECSRLLKVPIDSVLYCTLSVDALPWLQLIDSKKKLWEIQDVEVVQGQTQLTGLAFKEEFVLEKYEVVVVVDTVEVDSPAKQADIRKGDILVAVGTTRITSSKQATRAMKNAGERFLLRIERPKQKGSPTVEVHFYEESICSKDLEQDAKSVGGNKRDDNEDFVNISFKSNEKLSPGDYQGVKKGLSLLSSGTAIFRGQHSKSVGDEGTGSKSSQSSPEVHRKFDRADELKKEDRSQSAESSPKRGISGGRRRAHSDTSLFKPSSEKSDSLSGGEMDSSSDSDDELADIRRTKDVPSCQNPIWNEKILFDCDVDHKFINVCVWCKMLEKVDKHDRVLRPQKEILMGHVSLSLTDIALDCLMVLQGETQQTVHLIPAENKAGASRAKFSSFYGHKGFDANLCYGDITLGLYHQPTRMSENFKKTMTKKLFVPEVIETDDMQVSQLSADDKIKSLEERKHDFTGTQFNTATYCHFCGKKIWLKVALQCSLCQMTCHKKCTDKCQTQTLCSRDGVKVRASPSKAWRAPVTRSQQDRPKSEDDRDGGQKSGGLLSKISKTVQAKHASIAAKSLQLNRHTENQNLPLPPSPPTPHLSPPPVRKRRGSAPDNNNLSTEAVDDGSTNICLTLSSTLPRTRSSTSLQSLITQNAPPCLLPDERHKGKTEDSESSEESESEVHAVLRIVQKRRNPGQNLDEMVVTAAKEMGRELFAHLSLDERKEKLDATVTKLQQEIDTESESKSTLIKREQETVDPLQRECLQNKVIKSEEKMEALMVLMLHYCAGLQHCLDQQEEERQKAMDKQCLLSACSPGNSNDTVDTLKDN